MTEYPIGKLQFNYRCEAGHLTQSVMPLPDEATCWHCPNGEPCHAELYQEPTKVKR